MAGINMVFNGKSVGEKLKLRARNFTERQTKAVQVAARQVAETIETEGRASIRAGGNFGSERWQGGFRALVSFQSRADIRIRVTHSVFFWRVFEYGAKILGRPLLWIPLSWNKFKGRARDFPGKLFRVDRIGKSPLLMNEDGAQYVGKESVTIPRKWHLRDVVRRASRKMGGYYREAMKRG